jgi:hypothetical protein
MAVEGGRDTGAVGKENGADDGTPTEAREMTRGAASELGAEATAAVVRGTAGSALRASTLAADVDTVDAFKSADVDTVDAFKSADVDTVDAFKSADVDTVDAFKSNDAVGRVNVVAALSTERGSNAGIGTWGNCKI